MSILNVLLDRLPAPVVRTVIHRVWKFQEPELRRLDDYLDPTRGAVDIGTWWGPWTATFAKRCPHVHSFEPQPELAAQLRSWVPSHVTVHEAAVSDAPGSASLNRPNANPGSDGLATLRAVDGGENVTVEVVQLDDLDLGDIGLMKIDVEGFELPALRGAESTIAGCRPRLMIEIEQRHLDRPIDEVFSWVIERDYEGWFLRSGSWRSLSEFDVQRDQLDTVERPKSAAYINAFLFTPEAERWRP